VAQNGFVRTHLRDKAGRSQCRRKASLPSNSWCLVLSSLTRRCSKDGADDLFLDSLKIAHASFCARASKKGSRCNVGITEPCGLDR